MARDTSFNPWLSIWTSPRATIQRLVAEHGNRGFWLLAIIYGFSGLLNFFQSISLGGRLGIGAIFLLALLLSVIWGYVSFSVWSFAVWLTGKLFKGAADFKVLRFAYAWSCTPFIVNAILWLVMAFIFGGLLFMNFHEDYPFTQGQVILMFLILILRIGVGIWSLVIYLNALCVVQNYSIFRAIGNVILGAIFIAIVFYLLGFLFFMHM